MTISVFIDNNVWDFLFDHKIDLVTALPHSEFSIGITREAEFEIPPIAHKKPALLEFIESTISRCGIEADSYFGFEDHNLPPGKQRVAGFDFGRFASDEELKFMDSQRALRKPSHSKLNPKTELYKQEADIALAARSFHSVVLTLDAKKGPLADAHVQGGKVVFLAGFDPSAMSLGDFVKQALSERGGFDRPAEASIGIR